jgi:hypothetical protein
LASNSLHFVRSFLRLRLLVQWFQRRMSNRVIGGDGIGESGKREESYLVHRTCAAHWYVGPSQRTPVGSRASLRPPKERAPSLIAFFQLPLQCLKRRRAVESHGFVHSTLTISKAPKAKAAVTHKTLLLPVRASSRCGGTRPSSGKKLNRSARTFGLERPDRQRKPKANKKRPG